MFVQFSNMQHRAPKFFDAKYFIDDCSEPVHHELWITLWRFSWRIFWQLHSREWRRGDTHDRDGVKFADPRRKRA